MDTVLIPLDVSLTKKPSEEYQDSSIDPYRSVHHSTRGQTNEIVGKRYLLFHQTKVLGLPLQTSRLSSFLEYLEECNFSTVKLFKSPVECNFILAGPTPSQFCFYANATEVFAEIISYGKSNVDAIKALEELLTGFCAACASETESGVDLKWSAEPNIGNEEKSHKTKNVVSLSQNDEQQALRITCGGIVLQRLKDNKHEEPNTYPCCFDFFPRVGSFLASQDKSGSQVKQNVKKIFQMNSGFGNEKLKKSKCSSENERLKESVEYWKWKLHEMCKKFELERSDREKLARELAHKTSLLGSQSAQIAALENDLQNTRTELAETSLQLGQLSYENEKMIQEKKRGLDFSAMFKSNVSIATQTPGYIALNDEQRFTQSENVLGASAFAHSEVAGTRLSDHLPLNNTTGVSVQETTGKTSPKEWVRLSYVPSTAVERGLYNMYKLLLLITEDALLCDDVTKLKEWAGSMLSVNVSGSVGEIFLELDKKGVISCSNLNLLKDFFEKIIRIDLVYLIDCFLRGDYSLLQQTKEGLKNRSRSINPRSRLAPLRSPGKAQLTATTASSNVSSPAASSMCSATVGQTKFQGTSKNFKLPDDQRQAQGFGKLVHRNVLSGEIVTDSCRGNGDDAKNEAEHGANLTNNNVGKADVTASNQPSPPVNHDQRPRFDMGSNGKKLSKFQRPDTAHNRRLSPQDCESDDDDASQWLCNHYKRRCYVKFDCCNKYWPCHRCHNSKSNCGQNKLKSRDTKFIKCVKCGTEQQFNEGSQFCIQCETRLAKYFCFICKHLTGTDDHPYHCDKCGICRIHGDRSFHCDVCGVCLDVQLRGNHKCRAGSAHDECCICLEDAFTGCQILPCSHKVHKECATQMIRSGITRCPICRESFAHKLERRPQPQKKTSRKKVTQW